jgi:ketopantoate reductase
MVWNPLSVNSFRAMSSERGEMRAATNTIYIVVGVIRSAFKNSMCQRLRVGQRLENENNNGFFAGEAKLLGVN